MRLYRAADTDYVPTDSCSFAESLEAAEHYRDNPGYGGSTLWVAEVDVDDDDSGGTVRCTPALYHRNPRPAPPGPASSTAGTT